MTVQPRSVAPYIFYGQTTSLCATCHTLIPAKIIIEGNDVFYVKRCSAHGVQKVRISSDAAYYKSCHSYLKPGDRPLITQTRTDFGCPYDCGLCPDHEQHSCLALIDVNDECNLTCPVCFADSSPQRTGRKSLETIERMLDALVASEGEPDLVQFSGGEPTLHPQILEIIALAKSKPIRHVMLNTNGIRIAREPEFVTQLAAMKRGFEVYLQFDSLNPAALKTLRGADLSRVRIEALEALEKHDISTTLVVTVKKSVNDHEVGAIINYALQWSCVRGVTFQPVQDAGRNTDFKAKDDRVLLSEIRRAIIDADNMFTEADVIPLPCNPESIAIAYALRRGKALTPVTSFFPKSELVSAVPNAVTFEKYPELHKRVFEFFSLATAQANTSERLQSLLCCLPEIPAMQGVGYQDTFRVTVIEFLDAHNFCLGRVKRSCVHFVTPNGQIIPFDTYNLFYRDGKIAERRTAAGVVTKRARVGP